MNADDVARQLEEIANAGDDFEYQSTQLTERWKNDVNGAEAVEPILRFMESHPDVDMGRPGRWSTLLRHFQAMNRSSFTRLNVNQLPTPWGCSTAQLMGNAADPKKRQVLLATLMRVLENPQANFDDA